MTVWAVFKRDLLAQFVSPSGWAFLAGFSFLAGMFFSIALSDSGEASLGGVLANLGVVLLFGVPLVTMRQIAEESRSGTAELVLTAPVPLSSWIIGKWAAAMALVAILLALTLPFPLVLSIYGDPDPATILTAYLGLLLTGSGFVAAGLFASALTADVTVAGVGAILMLLPFWLAGLVEGIAPEPIRTILSRASFTTHLHAFARGAVDTADIAYFAAFTFGFLFLTWQSLESRRWR
jgi:ABC-2 type transport system permease protein